MTSKSGEISGWKRRDCSDAPVTSWWRLRPSDAFDRDAVREMRAALSHVRLPDEPRWRDAVAGNAAAAIGIVFAMKRAQAAEPAFDLAMTALAACAVEGNAAARVVLANIVRQMPGAGYREARVATSWAICAFDVLRVGGRGAT